LTTVSQPLKSTTEDDGPSFDADIEEAIRTQRAAFDQFVSAWYYSRSRFNDSVSSRERWRHYLNLDQDGKGLYSAFVATHGRVIGSFYCNDVPAAVALTRRESNILQALRSRSTLHQVVSPPGSSPLTAFALDLFDFCDDIARDAGDYLPIRTQRHVLDDVCGLSGDALALLDEAAQELAGGAEPVLDPEQDKLCANAGTRRTRIRSWVDQEARNASQFFYLRGVGIGCLGALFLAWVASRAFPAPIPKAQAAWAIAAGSVGALVSVLIRMKKTAGLKLDYRVGPRRLYLNGALRALLGSLAGLVFVFAATSGVIPLAQPDGTTKLDALYVLFSFIMGFNERLFEDMLANIGDTISSRGDGGEDGARRKDGR
jgi:hypothetical protein